MSLLQNEDFAIYQLRTSYLANVHDGVGERLINVNTAFLNNPAFRAAGWSANPPEIKRCYSPPIPTAVTSEYFQAPPRSAGAGGTYPEDEDEGGMLTGTHVHGIVGPAVVKRNRRREQPEDDDSSDLSDESEDFGEELDRPAQQIRFAKMPERSRAGSSPIRGLSQREDPNVLVTSPSRPPDSRPRRGSLGAVEAMKERARRDTTTSSEISSENDLDPSVFKRREIAQNANAKNSSSMDKVRSRDEPDSDALDLDPDPENLESDSDDSSLASDLLGSDESASFFTSGQDPMNSSPYVTTIPRPATPRSVSPKKTRQAVPTMAKLPPARPISTIQPRSALSAAIRAKDKKPVSPFERFTTLSGTGDPNPFYVKIYTPFASNPSKPVEMLMKRYNHVGDQVTVADALGLSLWRYVDEKIEPPLLPDKMNVNRWTLRMVEDGEVDFDFPALTRTRPMTDFAMNNNRGARARSRDKPWDEFALVEATESQFRDNESSTPMFSQDTANLQEESEEMMAQNTSASSKPTSPIGLRQDPFSVSRPFPAVQKHVNALDAPTAPIVHAIPRTGALKTLNIHFTDLDLRHNLINIPVTTDTYIAEVFDEACRRFNLDKALYVLKVTNSNTVAPVDRTVEALGQERSSLDLVRRRFIGGESAFGLGFSGSPGSTSPNAPLFLTTSGTPTKKYRKRGVDLNLAGLPLNFGLTGMPYKRYNVLRKQPMSFAPPHPRVLVFDGEYLQILPGEATNGVPGEGKVATVHFTSVVGCKVSRKHPKTFRIVIFKERETKRYDFEAPGGAIEAAEIVAEIQKGIEKVRDSTLRKNKTS